MGTLFNIASEKAAPLTVPKSISITLEFHACLVDASIHYCEQLTMQKNLLLQSAMKQHWLHISSHHKNIYFYYWLDAFLHKSTISNLSETGAHKSRSWKMSSVHNLLLSLLHRNRHPIWFTPVSSLHTSLLPSLIIPSHQLISLLISTKVFMMFSYDGIHSMFL